MLVPHSRRLIYRSRSIRLTFPSVSRAHKRASPTVPVPLLFTTAMRVYVYRAFHREPRLLTFSPLIFSPFFLVFPFSRFSEKSLREEKCARFDEINEDARKDRPFSLVISVCPVEVGFLFHLTRSELLACYLRLRQRGNILDWITAVSKRHGTSTLVDTGNSRRNGQRLHVGRCRCSNRRVHKSSRYSSYLS